MPDAEDAIGHSSVLSNELFRGYALLVGVGETPHLPGVSPLPVVSRDVTAIETILKNPHQCGYFAENVRLLVNADATLSKIIEGFEWLSKVVGQSDNATAIVYFSCHGIRDVASGRFGLVPYDCCVDQVGELDTNAVFWSNAFLKLIDNVPAQRLLVLIDCCHAEGIIAKDRHDQDLVIEGYKKSPPTADVLNQLMHGKGKAFISSCEEAQYSYILRDASLSIFTKHLLDALQGANSQASDTDVRLSNLINHLGKTVSATVHSLYGREQTPVHNFNGSDFPIALLTGGKGF